MKKIFNLLLLLWVQQVLSQTIYVDSSATGLNNGSSWANAYTHLQDALAATSSGTIWVAKGVYYPDKGVAQVENNRSASFILKNNVAIYGGFTGTETDISQRDWLNNVTILSGEIDGILGNAGNSYNVVRSDGVNRTAILDGFTISGGGYIIPYVDPGTYNRRTNADNGMAGLGSKFYGLVQSSPLISTAFLAGFIITGAVNVADASPNEGGGMYNLNASPTISNCHFSGNQANFRGGGMYNLGGSPAVVNCSFTGNSANQDGGGIYNLEASPVITGCRFSNWGRLEGGGMYNQSSSVALTNCSFYANGSEYDGAGMFNTTSTVTMTNCSFWRNRAYDHAGGGMYNQLSNVTLTNCSFSENSAVYGGGINNYSSSPVITNCIFWGNSSQINNTFGSNTVVNWSIVQGGYSGTNNLNVDPSFVNSSVGDLHLQCGSPAVDAGNNDVVTTTTDLDGKNRIVNNRVDMGVYETQGKVAYVNKNAIGLNDGSSWENAFTSLQDALAQSPICNLPTQLWVASGFYYPDEGTGLTDNDPKASFHLKKGVAIYGGFVGTETQVTQRNSSAYTTVLSGDIDGDQTPVGNAYHVITADSVDYTAVLDGFTIVRGNANGVTDYDKQGGGMHISSSNPRISNCIFWGHQAREGGAIYAAGTFPSFFRCSFRENNAATGGAIYNTALTQLTVLNCSFTQNSGLNGGGIYNAPHTVLNSTNNLFFENSATGSVADSCKGGAVYNSGAYVYLTNCSFTANNASLEYGGAIYNEGSSPNITNTILWGNNSEIVSDGNSNPAVSYSLIQGGYAGGTNIIDQDPLFLNALFGDLHLRGCSPAIDAGTSEGTYFADLDGNPRSVFNGVDIGAYEFQPGGPGGIVYVKADAGGNNDGTSWANAFTRLQDALARAGRCKALEIWVAIGTYYPTDTSTERTASFVLQNNVTILGGFKGTESPEGPQMKRTDKSILSGDIDRDGTLAGNVYHVVQGVGNDLTAILDGFIITGGHADGETAPDNAGAGIYLSNASPIINRCTITANTAANDGAGMYNDHSSPTIGRCIFSQNKTTMHGGGIYNYYSSPTITNALFWKDTAAYGGGIYNYYGSSPRVTNCTFVANGYSQYGGGIFNSNQTYPVITNCIFWSNSSQVYTATNSAPVVSYSIVQGGYPAGTMIINQDPLFVNAANGDFHISKESQANDAGTPDGAPAVDLDGFPRGRVTVDIGAYEYASTQSSPLLTLTCPQDFTINTDATGCGAAVQFTGDHAATSSGGTAPVTITYAPASGTLLPVGINTIIATAADGASHTKTCSFMITVVDKTPPVIAGVTTAPSVLYPPNHKMQNVTVNYDVSDNCSVTTELSVTSNEPEYSSGSGDTGPDWQVVNDHKVQLRVERSGNGSDRIYTITITASDASGNTSAATTTVTVPHDKAPMTSTFAAASREAGSLVVNVVPNPSSESFTLHTESPSNLPLSIKVIDGTGRMIESRSGVVANGMLNIGNTYRTGVYYVQVVQGDVLQTLKLVKQNR